MLVVAGGRGRSRPQAESVRGGLGYLLEIGEKVKVKTLSFSSATDCTPGIACSFPVTIMWVIR